MHHIHADAVGWRVDPWLVRTGSDLESHRDQAHIVSDVVAYLKLLVFRQVRDRLGGPNGIVYFEYRVSCPGWDVLITRSIKREKKYDPDQFPG